MNNTSLEVKTYGNKDGVKVMWFSRHDMSPEQEQALIKKHGEIHVTKVNGTVGSAYELKEYIDAADVVAIVAPIGLQQQFLKLAAGKPVITAISDRIVTKNPDGTEDKIVFQFNRWDVIRKIDVVVEEYCR